MKRIEFKNAPKISPFSLKKITLTYIIHNWFVCINFARFFYAPIKKYNITNKFKMSISFIARYELWWVIWPVIWWKAWWWLRKFATFYCNFYWRYNLILIGAPLKVSFQHANTKHSKVNVPLKRLKEALFLFSLEFHLPKESNQKIESDVIETIFF